MSVKSNFPIFSVLTRTLKKSLKFVRLSSFNKNLNRSNNIPIIFEISLDVLEPRVHATSVLTVTFLVL